jgi:RNA polymerase sigma-70 factor, ECF subfamily
MIHERDTIIESSESAPAGSRGNAAEDAALFARFVAGDDDALVTFFDRHNHRIFLYCLHLVRTRERAEDHAQEMWERVIRMRDERRLTAANPLGLAVTIARNLCLDALRRDRGEIALEDIPESAHPIERIPELGHLEELVIQALEHLPLDQREVLVLSAYSGYRYDEIAEILGEPYGAIRTRAWRARAHLGRIVAAMVGISEDAERSGGER